MLITKGTGELFNCAIKLRGDPQRQKDKVYIGCGAGFAGDRPQAALKLLQRVQKLDYLVLECLAERTLADRYQHMMSGGKGYDPRILDWMSLLLPLAMERGVCIITNMGAVDPLEALQEVMDVARNLGLDISASVAYEDKSGHVSAEDSAAIVEGSSTYLRAAPIVHCLERYKPHVVITSRVADAALFLAPMVYELGWDWDDFELLAQGALAGHLMECGCQLFRRMEKGASGDVSPNDATFLSVLSACGHSGLVDERSGLFSSMKDKHGLDPRPEHYACVIDLLGWAHRMDEAWNVFRKATARAGKLQSAVCLAMFNSCTMCMDLVRDDNVVKHLLEMDPDNPSICVSISNFYAASCGAACKCGSGCAGCGMYADLAEGGTTSTVMIMGFTPAKGQFEGFELFTGAENGGCGCKCGDNCNCNPCKCGSGSG